MMLGMRTLSYESMNENMVLTGLGCWLTAAVRVSSIIRLHEIVKRKKEIASYRQFLLSVTTHAIFLGKSEGNHGHTQGSSRWSFDIDFEHRVPMT